MFAEYPSPQYRRTPTGIQNEDQEEKRRQDEVRLIQLAAVDRTYDAGQDMRRADAEDY